MQISELYGFVLLLVMTGFLVGVGVLALDKFTLTPAVTATANTSIQAARDEIGNVATTWFGLIVTIGVLAIILFMIIRSFRGGR